MNIVKEKESEMICRYGEVQPVDSFCGTFDIWFTSKTGNGKLTEGLASDFTDADGVYNTFNEALESALSFPEEIYEEYIVTIQFSFGVWDEDSEAHLGLSVDLLRVYVTPGNKRFLCLDDGALKLLKEQYPEDYLRAFQGN